jgi:hypothetical protein
LTRPRRARLGLFLVLAGSFAACGEPAGPIDDDTYVAVMAGLSFAQARFLDVASADSARRAVIEDSGIDPADLVAFAEANGANTEKMFALHERVLALVDSLVAIESGILVPPGDSIGAEPDR